MEDGSAVPVENIIVQSGALGFYQKRLFLCTCLLQALTVSTLIYASHCRPELAPPAPVSATNGALAHHSKCGSRSGMNENDLGLENETSTVSETLLKHYNQSNGDVEHDVVVNSVTAPPAVLSSGGDGGGGEVSRGYENATLANIDESTESVDRDDGSVSSISTGTVTHKHRHHSSKHDDHGVRRKTSVKVSSDAVTQSLLNDVTYGGRLQTDVTPSGFYSSSPGVPEHQVYINQDSGMYDSSSSDNIGESTTNSSRDLLKEKRDSSLSKDGAFDGTESGDITSTDHVRLGWSTESGDVTVSGDEDKNCEEEHKEEEPFYLTMTYLPAPEWMLDANNEQLAQYNAYCQAVGAMVGAAIGAMGADHVGRRRPLYVCFPFMLIAHCMSGCAVSWTMLAVLRFLVGFFAGACAVVSLVFPLEFIGTEWRDACVCSGVWMVGVVVISLELLVTRHWRYLAFISGGIGLPLVGTYFIASESARWLLCHQKFPDAEQTLKEIVSCNSSSVPDFLSLFDKSRACVVTNMHHKRYTFLDLFHSLEMTKWTFALVYTCLVGSSVYFCLFAKVKAMTGIVYLDNSIPFVIDLPLGWSAVVVNRW
ncbi:solute carrier family 22 member 4-like [Littorina saxatilis]|uniref:solute carrier family 22 member 4-like n=1 Tax=Littorina saxatilis TaxID=31220 RepID=UPI0038B47169